MGGVRAEGASGSVMSQERELPLLALRGLVIFPFMLHPLEVGRARSIVAVEDAAVRDRLILLAAQRDPQTADPAPSDIHEVGVVAEVRQLFRLPEGKTRVLVEGLTRARALSFTRTEPGYRVRAAGIDGEGDRRAGQAESPADGPQAASRRALLHDLLQALDDWASVNPRLSPDLVAAAASLPEEDAGRLADTVAGQIPLSFEEKQMLLETLDPAARVERLLGFIRRELQAADVQRRMQGRLRRQADRSQKEQMLREQMRAIQRDLGEKDERESEADEFRRRIREASMPDEARQKAEHELARLEKMPPMAAEAVVVRNYLDWLVSLPWATVTPDRLDVELAERILNEDHYGLGPVKERVLEFLAVRQLAPKGRLKGPILCLIGPPGVGKTSLARSIARALERRFVRFSLGGVRDEAEIRGHRRTYVGAMPGKIIQAIRQAGSRNPVILLDEVDKMSYDFRGDPSAALLEVLDPEQNHVFGDHYLEVPYDLSDVLFVTTGNVLSAVPRALRDRMEVITIPGYTEYEKTQIALRHLIPRLRQDHNLSDSQLCISPGAVSSIVRFYTREAGVRELERQLATICRRTARAVVREPGRRTRVSRPVLDRWLGPPRYRDLPTEAEDRVGLALGLAYTEAGGDLLAIEVAVVPGRGKLWLTGKLGDVMRESAQASYSYVRSRAGSLGVDPGFYERVDIHVHIPEGGIPKDGPSAGITMAVALVSALTGRPVRRDAAMTGEITLRGRVLPVGGVKEKVLAAHRYGVRSVILPAENGRDLEEVPEPVRRQMEMHLVRHMDEVLGIALAAAVERRAATAPLQAQALNASVAHEAPPEPDEPCTGSPDPDPPGDLGGDEVWPVTA